jgi:uncharacterized coiled-coil protein SlyX
MVFCMREACIQYGNEREKANKEEMESLAMPLGKNSQELTMNNEMVMEHGRQAVAVRDERVAEMQIAINELSESLVKKDVIIEQRNERIKELVGRVERNATDASHRLMLSGWDVDKLTSEITR